MANKEGGWRRLARSVVCVIIATTSPCLAQGIAPTRQYGPGAPVPTAPNPNDALLQSVPKLGATPSYGVKPITLPAPDVVTTIGKSTLSMDDGAALSDPMAQKQRNRILKLDDDPVPLNAATKDNKADPAMRGTK